MGLGEINGAVAVNTSATLLIGACMEPLASVYRTHPSGDVAVTKEKGDRWVPRFSAVMEL